MRILEQLPTRCSCPVCHQGCLCGDCSGCSNATLDRMILRNAKRLSVIACVILFVGGFVFFVPVVAMGATPTITEAVSVRLQPAGGTALPMGSIAFCLFGHGAVLVDGSYYPSIAQNQSSRRACR